MIASRLPPEPPDGRLATAIHTATFNCFISTAPVNSRWETVIFEGDPGIDRSSSARLRMLHPADCDPHDAALLNEIVSTGLDMFGEAGVSLSDACERVAWGLIGRGVVVHVDWELLFE